MRHQKVTYRGLLLCTLLCALAYLTGCQPAPLTMPAAVYKTLIVSTSDCTLQREFTAASVLQPIFNRGQLTTNLKIAKARQEEALIQFRQTVLTAGNEVNDALADLQNARTTGALEREQVARLEATLSDTEAQMRYGSGNALQVLTARQSLLNAQLGQLNTGYKELAAYIKLCAALGGHIW